MTNLKKNESVRNINYENNCSPTFIKNTQLLWPTIPDHFVTLSFVTYGNILIQE